MPVKCIRCIGGVLWRERDEYGRFEREDDRGGRRSQRERYAD